MLMNLRTLFTVIGALAAAAHAAPAAQCALCPTTDLGGDTLVENSPGTLGTPTFCGYALPCSAATV
jgi:hypothetical protein